MKKLIYGVVVAAVAVMFVLGSQAAKHEEQQCLATALDAVGIGVKESSINGWAQLDEKKYPDDGLVNIVNQCMKRLGAKEGEYNVTINTSPYHYTVRADKVTDGYHAVVMTQALYNVQQNKKREVYLVINVEAVNSDAKPNLYEKEISEIISDIGGSPRITTCLVGWFDGKLDTEHWASTMNMAFAAIDATIIDSVTNANFVSYTGYTPNIGDGLKVGNQRVNVHLAMRYSPYDDRTYMIIGSPIIIREY